VLSVVSNIHLKESQVSASIRFENGNAIITVPLLENTMPSKNGYSEHIVDKEIFDADVKYEGRSVFASVMICARTQAGEMKRQSDFLRIQARDAAKKAG
jgi:hypothetical protein